MDVRPGKTLGQKVLYGNHPSADAHDRAVIQKAVGDVANARAMVVLISSVRKIRGLHISSTGVVEEKGKFRVVHDLTFGEVSHGGEVKTGRAVSATTDS